MEVIANKDDDINEIEVESEGDDNSLRGFVTMEIDPAFTSGLEEANKSRDEAEFVDMVGSKDKYFKISKKK